MLTDIVALSIVEVKVGDADGHISLFLMVGCHPYSNNYLA